MSKLERIVNDPMFFNNATVETIPSARVGKKHLPPPSVSPSPATGKVKKKPLKKK